MNAPANLFATVAILLIFALLFAVLLMPHFSKAHAGDGAGMKIAAFAIGLFLLIALLVFRS